MQKSLFFQLLFNGAATGSIYAIVALGFGLIYNTTRIFHISYGIAYTLSGYLLLTAFTRWHLPLPLAIIISLLGAAVLGVLTELIVYRPHVRKGAPEIILFISSLGLYIILQNLLILIYSNQSYIIDVNVGKSYYIGSLVLGKIQITSVAVLGTIIILFYLVSRYTNYGRTLKAISNNRDLAIIVGINIWRYRLAVFAIGSVLAACGSVLSALDFGTDPNVGFPIALIAIVSVIAGGVGVFEGAFVGGLLIGLLQAISVWQISAKWQNSVVFFTLIFFLLFRPQGLLGSKRRVEEVTA